MVKPDAFTDNVAMKKTPPPNALIAGLTPAEFLRDYWHKKPLLIRQAIPGFKPLLSREALFDMAASEDVESRLITHVGKQWQMQNGPFDALPPTTRKDWTLLVQGVNLHDDAADALMRRFDFIPDARLDDLMISYATDTGGVGAHFDSYDVFLLQAHGQRKWRIGAQKDLTLRDDMPLKILKNFTAEQEFVLEPGDMLYLPPQYAHEGVAVGECMTYSIGFRAPAYQELGEAFLQFMADSIDLKGRYADPDLKPPKHRAELGTDMLERVSAELNKVSFTPEDITIFLGQYLTEPKPQVIFDRPKRALTPARFQQTAARRGVRLSRKSIMLHRGSDLFINGASFNLRPADRKTLKLLADERRLDGAEVAAASADVLEALHMWHEDGWLELG